MNPFKTMRDADRAIHRRLLEAGCVGRVEPAVDDRLHGRIMQRVRQADPERGRDPGLSLMATGALASLLVLVAVGGWLAGSVPVPSQTPLAGPASRNVLGLEQRLAGLETGPVLPEAALRQEYERLKSDLRKLGIES